MPTSSGLGGDGFGISFAVRAAAAGCRGRMGLGGDATGLTGCSIATGLGSCWAWPPPEHPARHKFIAKMKTQKHTTVLSRFIYINLTREFLPPLREFTR